MAHKVIGITTSNLISNELIPFDSTNTIGIGATDQNGSYKLELFNRTLKIYIDIVAYKCQIRTSTQKLILPMLSK